MILYPTETIYGLGVNPLDAEAVANLYELKGRDASKAASWLVRDVNDIETYAELSYVAKLFAEQHLPGPLTLVLPAKPKYKKYTVTEDQTLSFRISSDRTAKKLIKDYMAKHNAPLTCTSANASGQPSLPTPDEIIEQLQRAGRDISLIDQVIDDGSRQGQASTVVRIIGDEVEVLRQGSIEV